MHKIKLVTDSTSDLSPELLKKHDIEVVPLHVIFKDKDYRDNIDLKTQDMYKIVKETNSLPKTAAASPGEFTEVFQKFLDQGYEIIFIGIGKNFSATYQSAHTAKQSLGSDLIHLIDSANLSSGTGLLVLKAAKYRDEGLNALEIKHKVEALVPKVRSQFVIDTLEYLYKGGRLNALATAFGTMLKIKPIIKVRDGLMAVGKKGRGSVKAAVDIMLNEAFIEKEAIDEDFLMITHSLAYDNAEYIKERLSAELKIKNVYETDAGCVISSHCGRGTIGILYILK
ncbi:MAG: DegV family protein [Candidatus Izemoplasmatales bacterium]|jgi:DegV family protein with EDD domain|nr:DegV family protein [Candidatus Izemoplasmatales bacterium]